MTDNTSEPFVDASPYFDILDAPRTDANAELSRVILDVFDWVEPHLPELDTWVSMPLRLVHDQAGGFRLELGPYDLDAGDILAVRNAIAAYDQATGRVQR